MGSDIFNVVTDSSVAIWLSAVFVISIIGCGVFLYVQSRATYEQKPGENVETMGHVWDETLEEYNNPMPSWWRNLFYITIIFAFIYLALYPGLIVFDGVKKWTQWTQLAEEAKVHEGKAVASLNKWSAISIADLSKDKDAMYSAKLLFIEKCSRCHGADAGGFTELGYPSLRDKGWLWGNTSDDVKTSIMNGRASFMPAHKDILSAEKIDQVASYVRILSKLEADSAKAAEGEKIFNSYCVACHNKDGTGNKHLGGKNLTTGIFNHGSTLKNITKSITNGIRNTMPAQAKTLGKARAHLLAGYIWSLGGGKAEDDNLAKTTCGENASQTARFYFATGQAKLAADAMACLEQYVSFSKENSAAKIVLSGFHDVTGDAAVNAELAKNRAFAIRDMLVEAGVDETLIETKEPVNTLGSGTLAEARRVEVMIVNN